MLGGGRRQCAYLGSSGSIATGGTIVSGRSLWSGHIRAKLAPHHSSPWVRTLARTNAQPAQASTLSTRFELRFVGRIVGELCVTTSSRYCLGTKDANGSYHVNISKSCIDISIRVCVILCLCQFYRFLLQKSI